MRSARTRSKCVRCSRPSQGIPEVGWAIFPDYRNQGTGTKLIEASLDAISKQGFDQVSRSNSDARYVQSRNNGLQPGFVRLRYSERRNTYGYDTGGG